jgi:hypothetical protein
MNKEENVYLFFDFYNDFIYCAKKLMPEVVENKLFNEWEKMCKW